MADCAADTAPTAAIDIDNDIAAPATAPTPSLTAPTSTSPATDAEKEVGVKDFLKDFSKRFRFAKVGNKEYFWHSVDCITPGDFVLPETVDPSQILAFDVKPFTDHVTGKERFRVYYNKEYRFNPAKVATIVRRLRSDAEQAEIAARREYELTAQELLSRRLSAMFLAIREKASAGENAANYYLSDRKCEFEKLPFDAFGDAVEKYLLDKCEGVRLKDFGQNLDLIGGYCGWWVKLKW